VFTRLLVGYDGSPGSRAALQAALRLATGSAGQVTAVIVQHHLPRYGATVGEVDEERLVEAADARRLGNEIQAEADESGLLVTVRVVPGHPAQELVHAAKDVHADLIVLGHGRHTGLPAVLLGSVTEKVSRHAPCSVLIVRTAGGPAGQTLVGLDDSHGR
jgi:nucleotide-binding universal stress UspA family protein